MYNGAVYTVYSKCHKYVHSIYQLHVHAAIKPHSEFEAFLIECSGILANGHVVFNPLPTIAFMQKWQKISTIVTPM